MGYGLIWMRFTQREKTGSSWNYNAFFYHLVYFKRSTKLRGEQLRRGVRFDMNALYTTWKDNLPSCLFIWAIGSSCNYNAFFIIWPILKDTINCVEDSGGLGYTTFLLTFEKASCQVHVLLGLQYWLILQLQCVFYHLAYFKRWTKSCEEQWWLGAQFHFVIFIQKSCKVCIFLNRFKDRSFLQQKYLVTIGIL